MRYRIGEDPAQFAAQPVGEDGLTIFTAVFSLLAGVGFVLAGIRGRQRWLIFWGGVMIVASLAYLGSLFI